MPATTILKTVLKIAALTLLLTVLLILGTSMTGLAAGASTGDAGYRLATMLVTCLIDVLLFSYFIVRSRLFGLRLILATAFVFYGVKTFTAQLETAYFVTTVPRDMLPKLFAFTIPAAVVFPPVAVLLFGKMRRPAEPAPDTGPHHSAAGWGWRALLTGAVIYPVLFFGAGYFIAWRNPDVRAFYGGVDNPNAIAYFVDMFAKDPQVYPFEVLRGILWFVMALPIIRTLRGRPWQVALLVALIFALVENTQHLIPNPLMPDSVRMSHFIETSSSNFVLGLAVTGLCFWRAHFAPDTQATGQRALEMPSLTQS